MKSTSAGMKAVKSMVSGATLKVRRTVAALGATEVPVEVGATAT